MTRNPQPRLEELLLATELPSAPALAAASVVSVDEDGVVLALGGMERRASVALSCLVRPIEADLVLVFRQHDEIFVLSVLERVGPNYATLALPGNGNLAIEGETLSFTARQRLALKADSLDLRSRALSLIADKTTWLGKALTAVVERWRISARSHEVSADTLSEKAVTRVAVVDGVDTLRAETRSVKIAGIASETAQSKVIAVTDDLRVDGKRISMG